MKFPASRKILFALLGLALLGSGMQACSNSDEAILAFPAIVAIDSNNNRVFVVDNAANGLYLVDPFDFVIVGDGPLLGQGQNNSETINDVIDANNNPDDDPDADGEEEFDEQDDTPQLLQNFPSNAAVTDLGGTSRLFVIGSNGTGPANLMVALDYDTEGGIRNAPFTPVAVGGDPSAVLVGVCIDPARNLVWVTDSTNAQVHGYDVQNGVEIAGSPLTLTGMPGRIQFDAGLDQLVVSNLTATQINYIDPDNLAAPPVTIETGIFTRDAASVTNASGTVLFVSGNQVNTAKAFRVNFADPAATTQIFEALPPPPSGPQPADNFLTGTLNQLRAGFLTDGRIAAFYTQSSGDLLALDLSGDQTVLVPSLVTVGAISAEGIDVLLNASGQIVEVFYASPGLGTLTAVDPLTNLLIDQIN